MEIKKNNETEAFINLLEESLGSSFDESDSFNSYLSDVSLNKNDGSFSSSKLLNVDEYLNNTYLTLFKQVNFKKGNIVLTSNAYKPFESFLYNDTLNDENTFEEINYIGHFKERFSFPVLYKGKTPWMSIIPHEINTMKDSISECSGNVLTFGCGLGYFAFMASNKSNVSSVTIVENDPSVIAVFKEAILPNFPFKDKITIIQDNCFKFCKTSTNKYDYLFVDTYHTPEDGLPFYIQLQPLLKNVAIKTSFWIFKSIISYFRRYLISVLIDIYYGNISINDLVSTGEDILDDILCNYIQLFKDKIFTTREDLKEFLSEETIKENFLKI